MPRDVAVVFVHGIQAENINYAKPMQAKLEAKIARPLRRYVAFLPVFWAKAVRQRQQQYLDSARNEAHLPITDLRRFFVEGLGDAAAYQKTRSWDNSAYYKIQQCLTDELAELGAAGPQRPLIFIGHSLGCHIISSYAWDINLLKQATAKEMEEETEAPRRELALRLRDASPFRRLDTLAAIVTMGNNMPLFTFNFGPTRVFPITRLRPELEQRGLASAFPGAALPEGVKKEARWLNFYSTADALGYPLKPLNKAYSDEARIDDIPVRTGGPLSDVLPIMDLISAHTGYWTNATVVKRTAELIERIIEAPDA